MSKHPLAAAAEGLPSLTRRLFLRGAAVAAPMAAVPALAAVSKHYAEENPELLAMEPALEAAEAEMIAASDAYREALRIGRALWPKAPEAITFKRDPYASGNRERNIQGGSWDDAPGIYTADLLSWDVERCKRWRKMTPARQEMRDRAIFLYETAAAYERDCATAKEVSGFPAACDRREAAAKMLGETIKRVVAEKPETMAGIRIQARALKAWEAAPHTHRLINLHGTDWAQSFARAVLEIIEG